MAKRSIEESTLTALGDVIRRKTGKSGMLTPDGTMVSVLETLEDALVPSTVEIDLTTKTWQRGLLQPYDDAIVGASSYGLYTISFAKLYEIAGTESTIEFSAPDGCIMRISIADATGYVADGDYVKWTPKATFDISGHGNHAVYMSVKYEDNRELSDADANTLVALVTVKVHSGLPSLIADEPETIGQLACLSRIKQMRDIVYTPVAAMPYNGGTYPAGQPVIGLPYSSVRKTDKFIGFNVSLETFMTAVHNPASVLYTKESTESHARTWYGTNCSTFVSYVYDWDYHNATAIFAAMDCNKEIPVADMKLCDAANMINDGANGGHVVIISGIVRDSDGNIISVQISQSDGNQVSGTTMPYEAFLYDYIGLQGYKMYRNTDLYKTTYEPSEYIRLFADEPEQNVVYSDICTDFGDRATILTSESITLHPLKTAGYTAIKLYRGGEEVGSYDVANKVLNGLSAGKYFAKLIPETGNATTSFIVCSAEVSQDNKRYSFSCEGGKPVRVVFKNSTGFTRHAVDLTAEDIERGYIDIDYSDASAATVCVPFKNEYGFVVAQCPYTVPVVEPDEPETLLPVEYQQVEYIESTGTQYFDTGVLASDHPNGIKYVMDAYITQVLNTTNNNWYWGALGSSKRSGNLTYWGAGNYRFFAGGSETILQHQIAAAGTRVNIEIAGSSKSPGTVTGFVNGEEMSRQSTGTATEMPSANIYLMKCNGASSGSLFCGRLYSFTMDAADGTPIRNFIPCYRISDGVIGLYDTVGGSFYTNAGTGSFTKGKDVA